MRLPPQTVHRTWRSPHLEHSCLVDESQFDLALFASKIYLFYFVDYSDARVGEYSSSNRVLATRNLMDYV